MNKHSTGPPSDRDRASQPFPSVASMPRVNPDFAYTQTRSRAQSAPLAIVLILGIVVFGTFAIVATGGPALADAQRTSELSRAEQAFMQFDSRTSQVALGESGAQSIPLGPSGSGQYDIDEDAGWIRVVHHNYVDGSNETIYNDTFGSVLYRNGDTSIAYQGGGVWRADGPNESVMVAPPEFHYRSETLVMPIVQVRGTDSAAGNRRALVSKQTPTTRIFPVETTSYGDGGEYRNPIKRGSVTVTVESEYYHAWGRFFEKRTGGTVTIDHSEKQATIELTAPRFIGDFRMPEEGNAIPIRGIVDGHQLEQFLIQLAPDNSDAARFNNLQWSMYVEDGPKEFELHLDLFGPDDDDATACKEQDISATVYYSDTNGNTYHGWHAPTAFQTTCTDRDGDGIDDETQLVANLTGEATLQMQDLTSRDLLYVDNPGSATRLTSVTFDEHARTVAWEPITYTDGGTNTAPVDDLLNHYFGLLGPDYDLVVDDQKSDSVSEQDSTGTLNYGAKGRVTYIHISANEVIVEFS